jgi:hypothetical protein
MEKLLRHETSPVTKLIGSWFTPPICLHKTDFERGLIRERVKAGLAAAKKKGIAIYTTFPHNKNNELQRHQAPSLVGEG